MIVQEVSRAIAEYSIVDLPTGMYTSDKEGFRRLRVDVAQTGFFEGREFRSFYEFSVSSGSSFVIKFTSAVDFILFEQSLSVDSGGIRFSAITGATETSSFNTSVPVIGKNRMSSRPTPYYTSQASISTGGTISGGTVVEVVRVITANSTAQESSVGGVISTERGLPAGTYYLKFENTENSTTTGVYALFWEERP